MIRLVDYVIKFLENKGVNCAFTVTGGGAMYLNDALCLSNKIKTVFNHHEQACTMAAVAYSKLNNKIPIVMPTTGCGGTNTITGLLDAWQDSNKVIFISGNVNLKETTYHTRHKIRKFGPQENNIIDIVKPLTKYSTMIVNPLEISYHLEKAFHVCNTGRPGPVWIDIPLDIQNAKIDENELSHFESSEEEEMIDYELFEKYLNQSQRPIVIAGNGIQLSNAKKEFVKFIEKYNLPVALTYAAVDYLPTNHKLNIGRLGIKGTRAGNFAVQNSDLIISFGSSLGVPVTGFRYETFAREAKKIVIDIDKNEHKKNTVKIDYEFNIDIKNFLNQLPVLKYNINHEWLKKCNEWKNKWEYVDYNKNENDKINIYYLIEKLSKFNKSDSITITDAGLAYYIISQSLKIDKNQRYVLPHSQGEMGFVLPAIVGIYFESGSKNIIGVVGDGSFQMNLQELQTIVNYKIPAKIFVLNNDGYISIKNTANKFFNGRYFGVDKNSGISFPELEKIAYAYDLHYYKLNDGKDLENKIENILDYDGPCIIEVICTSNQEVLPTSSAKENNEGKLVSQPLENMFPFLSDEEFKTEMFVKPI